MVMHTSLRRLAALLVAIGLTVGASLVALTAVSPASAAPACTDPAKTKLTLSPHDTTADVQGSLTVKGHVECDGAAGKGNAVDLSVTGVNPQKARGTADSDGNFSFMYSDDEGAGRDLITACTTDLNDKQVCDQGTVSWLCPTGQYPNGLSCGIVPGFGDYFGRAFGNSLSDRLGEALDNEQTLLHPDTATNDTSTTSTTTSTTTPVSTDSTTSGAPTDSTTSAATTDSTTSSAAPADQTAPTTFVDQDGNVVDENGNPLE